MLKTSKSVKKKFINSINYFRGIAIVLIVLGHCYELSNWQVAHKFEKVFYSLTLNGSVYFVFISGFLFHHIFFNRFDYQKFMSKKLQYVLLPYLFFSIVPIIYIVFLGNGGQLLPSKLQDRPILSVAWYLLTGSISYAYWYIPMAILLFAISPLIITLVKNNYLLKAICFFLAISLTIHRPVDNINTIHSLIYFLPVYLLGIYSSINQQKIYSYLKNKRIAILLIAIALGFVQVYLFKETGNFHKDIFTIDVPDINLIQKLLLCFLFMSILDDYETSDLPSLKKTAETSFAIYFIHPWVIDIIISLTKRFNLDYQGNLLTLIVSTSIVLIISIAIAMGIKRVLSKNSRYLIGW
ncbi:MAG: acyltransferase family protein [Pleurocapsa sp.]